ncbi:MAG: undecaprenyldiphospho-muramoylpentapeptide beta-N-acetylglucosaminyltransferase [Dehalococcoidia bacterium]|nr:undecaprenyldiphospho-muramoylpentapeptide beta-N-acetylglucosaminyltransferase [Dehalococcoidia bacterium]
MTLPRTGQAQPRLAATGGGTGGHVYPALAIIDAWRKLTDRESQVFYLGSRGGIEETLVMREGIPFTGIEAGPLRGKSPLIMAGSAARTTLGMARAWKELGRLDPDALLATGGYVSIPVAMAASLRRIPIVIYLPDIEPGWAVRALSPLSQRIAVTSDASVAYLPASKVVVTGYPVREDVYGQDKAGARRSLGLKEDLPTLLVLGGSRGARSINKAVGENLDRLLAYCQVIHVCGADDESWLRERASRIGGENAGRYALYPYLHSEFPAALAAADLALSRAGASVMGEYPAVGLPSILVPYPYAGSHQDKNASYLSRTGAAVVLRNGRVNALQDTVIDLLRDPTRLDRMAKEARALSRPDAARHIAELLTEAGRKHG